jgi:hypothetical protein
MNVLVLPSLTTPGWVEFFGRVLVEAMACEVPVIGSDSGEIPNVIGDAGLIFHEGEADDLRDKLLLLAHDENLQLELAERGKKRAVEKYSWEQIAADTYEVYTSLMAKRQDGKGARELDGKSREAGYRESGMARRQEGKVRGKRARGHAHQVKHLPPVPLP